MNWLDWTNPQAGGAELHLYEVFRRIVNRGHEVTLLCSSYEGAKANEFLEGIKILRRGNRLNFNYVVPFVLLTELRTNKYDIVVEDLNKLPFYTPLYVKRPVLALVHHLFGKAAFEESYWPVASYVYLSEKFLPYVFRKNYFEVVSHSTKDDLISRGISADKISVVYNGLDHNLYNNSHPEDFETPRYLLYLGRFKKYKRIDLILYAMHELKDKYEYLNLLIMGYGDYETKLKRISSKLGINNRVTFLGAVSQEKKIDLLRNSYLVINTSPKEGWGLTNIEALACGSPVIASDSPGLRESMVHGKTGYLVRHGDVKQLCERIATLLDKVDLRNKFARYSVEWVKQFSWERTTEETLGLIDKLLN